MSNKLLIFTGSLIATSGISGLGIMIYQDLLSGPIKSKKSITKKIQKTIKSAKKPQSLIPKSNKENEVLKVKNPDNTQKSKNPSIGSTITFSSEKPTTISSNLQDNSLDSSEATFHDSGKGDISYKNLGEDKDSFENEAEEEECIYEYEDYFEEDEYEDDEEIDENADVLKIE